MSKVAREAAQNDFDKWIEYKKINEFKRDEHKEFEDTIVNAIVLGDLTIDEDLNIHQKLSFPLKNEDGEEFLKDLTFKPRMNLSQLKARLKNVKGTDVDGRMIAHIAALTGQNSNLLEKLDTEDMNLSRSIIMYFL